jgi:hypothetical protein
LIPSPASYCQACADVWLKSWHENIRVARFFLLQLTKTEKICQSTITYTKKPLNMPNGYKIYQVAIKYTNIFHRMTLQNLSKLLFLVWKQTIWQPRKTFASLATRSSKLELNTPIEI